MRWVAIVVIAIFLSFGFSVYASEGIISPLADSDVSTPAPPVIVSLPAPSVLGVQSSLGNAVTQFFSVTPTPLRLPDFAGQAPLLPQNVAGQAPLLPQNVAGQAPTPTPTPATRLTRKSHMTITLLGDSMIDTLGPDGGGLAEKLNKTYPSATFTIINHGVGGQNIDTGLLHLTNGYSYLGATRPSVISQSPDVIVVESFGYNPYSYDTGALETHWLRLASIMDTIKQQLPQTKIVIAATIAPNWNVFGDGAPFINFSANGKRQKVATIDSYIESTISFAKGEHYPLADAYDASKTADGNGMIQYINPGDHIHYSDSGRAFFSQILANTIITNRLLE